MRQCFIWQEYFNPRSREGSDIWRKLHCRISYRFQSTLPRRERQHTESKHCVRNHFNPRSREGSDASSRRNGLVFLAISIHAPAKGATQKQLRILTIQKFQSTLPRRERHVTAAQEAANSAISIHAPAKGATVNGYKYIKIGIFQSTLPRRERRILSKIPCTHKYFNPRSREESDRIY